jgi:hypothetical protein
LGLAKQGKGVVGEKGYAALDTQEEVHYEEFTSGRNRPGPARLGSLEVLAE